MGWFIIFILIYLIGNSLLMQGYDDCRPYKDDYDDYDYYYDDDDYDENGHYLRWVMTSRDLNLIALTTILMFLGAVLFFAFYEYKKEKEVMNESRNYKIQQQKTLFKT